jgi:hypothetical protein
MLMHSLMKLVAYTCATPVLMLVVALCLREALVPAVFCFNSFDEPLKHTAVPRFTLGASVSAEQLDFFQQFGFLVFSGVLSAEEALDFVGEGEKLEQLWLKNESRSVYGVPLFIGSCDDGNEVKRCISRLPFTSVFSTRIHSLIHDSRFEPVRSIFSGHSEGNITVRIGDREKDGVVLNKYINPLAEGYDRTCTDGSENSGAKQYHRQALGWHTDGLRSLAYGRMPDEMINIGLHFDTMDPNHPDPSQRDSGLCVIPGTHRQDFLSMLLRKFYFLSYESDEAEVCLPTKRGDLTVHDGRLWHRVQKSGKTGAASLRRTAFMPYLTSRQPVEPKGEFSTTPFYHYIGMLIRSSKGGA